MCALGTVQRMTLYWMALTDTSNYKKNNIYFIAGYLNTQCPVANITIHIQEYCHRNVVFADETI